MTQPDSRWWWGLPGFGVLVVLWLVHAELLLTPTIPASYDLTGHLLPIAELTQRLLPQGRLHGWSNDWFAGFPLYYFYFPLPALLAAALAAVVSLEAALKLTSVIGLIAFPFANYVLFRAFALPRAHAAIAATVAATFLLMQSFWFLGGNIASTVAGEFAYSISFTLSLFYLATLLRASARPTSFIVPALLLAAIALSHLVTTIAIVAVSALLLRDPAKRKPVLLSWIAAFLLSAFWTVPFLLRHGEMAAVYTHAVRSFGEVMPLEMWPVIPGALAGALLARRVPAAWPLFYLTAAGLALFIVSGDFVYPGRFLPYWYLGAHMLAGFAIAQVLRDDKRVMRTVVIAMVALPLLLLNVARGTGYIRDWSGAAYGGLQARSSWPVLEDLFAQLGKGAGRVYWEQAPQQLGGLGSRNLASITPYVAPGQQVVNGLWQESTSLHAELVEIDSALARARGEVRQLDRALGKMRELGVTRFVALTPATAQLMVSAGVAVLQTTPAYAVFQLPGRPLVESTAGGRVEVLEWSDEHVHFRTTSPNTPHVVRLSWFPNWRAQGGRLERGANSMMLVTPQQNEVVLSFQRSGVEVAGTVISILAVLGIAAAAWLGKRDNLRAP